MPREQAQHTRQKKGGSNPGTFSPDDDEAQEGDRTSASDMPREGEQREAQDERQGPEDNIEQVEDEEAEDDEDEDESDDISQRP